MIDTGTCINRATGAVWMYRHYAVAGGTPPVEHIAKVWPVGGGDVVEMTRAQFDEQFTVQHRFDTSRVPDGFIP